jgi:hypothetical protein
VNVFSTMQYFLAMVLTGAFLHSCDVSAERNLKKVPTVVQPAEEATQTHTGDIVDVEKSSVSTALTQVFALSDSKLKPTVEVFIINDLPSTLTKIVQDSLHDQLLDFLKSSSWANLKLTVLPLQVPMLQLPQSGTAEDFLVNEEVNGIALRVPKHAFLKFTSSFYDTWAAPINTPFYTAKEIKVIETNIKAINELYFLADELKSLKSVALDLLPYNRVKVPMSLGCIISKLQNKGLLHVMVFAHSQTEFYRDSECSQTSRIVVEEDGSYRTMKGDLNVQEIKLKTFQIYSVAGESTKSPAPGIENDLNEKWRNQLPPVMAGQMSIVDEKSSLSVLLESIQNSMDSRQYLILDLAQKNIVNLNLVLPDEKRVPIPLNAFSWDKNGYLLIQKAWLQGQDKGLSWNSLRLEIHGS